MLNIVRAEHLKWRRTFIPKLAWIAPVFTLLLCAVLMGGGFFRAGLTTGGTRCCCPER